MKKYLALSLALAILLSATPALANSDSLTSSKKMKKDVDLACMQAATDKRDDAVIASWNTLHEDVLEALETRSAEIQDAWKIEDRKTRLSTIKGAWKEFRDTKKTATKEWHSDRKDAWKTFKGEAKACRGGDAGKENESVENI